MLKDRRLVQAGSDEISGTRIGEELERILISEPFRHSRRSQELLRYIVEHALAGEQERLKERSIAVELFGREPDYDTTQDAIVRVAANDVRKRLSEYYRAAGPVEVRVTLPTGSYVPVFEAVVPEPALAPQGAVHSSRPRLAAREWTMLAGLAVLSVISVALWMRGAPAAAPNRQDPPWPLSRVMQDYRRTVIVAADSNAGMLGVLRGRPLQLEEYLRPGFLPAGIELKRDQSGIGNVISGAQLTSYADALLVSMLCKAAGRMLPSLDVRYARGLQLREFQDGNFILLGSPSSNPWVSLFDERLNFREKVGFPEPREFVNRLPAAGEPERFRGFGWTGSAGEEYATISLLPTESRHGNVLILQGLHQEGTETAGALVTTEAGQRKLHDALRSLTGNGEPAWFEAVIRTRAVAGSTRSTEVVAARVWKDTPAK